MKTTSKLLVGLVFHALIVMPGMGDCTDCSWNVEITPATYGVHAGEEESRWENDYRGWHKGCGGNTDIGTVELCVGEEFTIHYGGGIGSSGGSVSITKRESGGTGAGWQDLDSNHLTIKGLRPGTAVLAVKLSGTCPPPASGPGDPEVTCNVVFSECACTLSGGRSGTPGTAGGNSSPRSSETSQDSSSKCCGASSPENPTAPPTLGSADVRVNSLYSSWNLGA